MSICVGGDVRVCVCAGETEEKKMKHKNGENLKKYRQFIVSKLSKLRFKTL